MSTREISPLLPDFCGYDDDLNPVDADKPLPKEPTAAAEDSADSQVKPQQKKSVKRNQTLPPTKPMVTRRRASSTSSVSSPARKDSTSSLPTVLEEETDNDSIKSKSLEFDYLDETVKLQQTKNWSTSTYFDVSVLKQPQELLSDSESEEEDFQDSVEGLRQTPKGPSVNLNMSENRQHRYKIRSCIMIMDDDIRTTVLDETPLEY